MSTYNANVKLALYRKRRMQKIARNAYKHNLCGRNEWKKNTAATTAARRKAQVQCGIKSKLSPKKIAEHFFFTFFRHAECVQEVLCTFFVVDFFFQKEEIGVILQQHFDRPLHHIFLVIIVIIIMVVAIIIVITALYFSA